MAGGGTISLAENNTRPSTLAYTSGSGEVKDVEGRGEESNYESNVGALWSRFER